jgi:phosphate-selective porin
VRSTSFLVIQRLNVDAWRRAGFGVEYRLLEQSDGGGRRQGWLAEGYWRLQEHVRFGIGYDFTDFTDDGSHTDDYEVRGLFLRVQGTY